MTGTIERAVAGVVSAETDLAAECGADIATISTLHGPPHAKLRADGIDELDEANEIAESFVRQAQAENLRVVSRGVYRDGDGYVVSVEAEVDVEEREEP